MHPIQEALANALQIHRSGRLREAKELYNQVLRADPNSTPAWHLLGTVSHQLGEHAAAERCFRSALAQKPDFPEAHNNLGLTLAALGHADDACDCFRRALELNPKYAEAYYNLGNIHYSQGDIEKAAEHYRQAIGAAPSYAHAHANLGSALQRQGKIDEAERSYRRALELVPNHSDVLNGLGSLLQMAGRLQEAVDCHRRGVELVPNDDRAWFNLGTALMALKSNAQAAECFQDAIGLNPGYAEAYENLGLALQEQFELDNAIACYQRALQLRPGHVDTIVNLATVLKAVGRFGDAAAHIAQALALSPDLPGAHFNRATLMLLTGDLANGWPEYEWRWRTGQLPTREFSQPRWKGEPLAGKTILIWAEQGLGDTLQFVRYAPVVKKLGATVVVECQKPLARLIGRSAWTVQPHLGLKIDRLVVQGDELPDFDYQISLLSLPGVFKTTLDSIPGDVPYLFADQTLVNEWREKLADTRALKSQLVVERPTFLVGVNWQGGPGKRETRQRNIPVQLLESVAGMPGVKLISLQKDDPESDSLSSKPKPGTIIDLGEFDTVHGAFMDTAAIMMNLDLVITSDTSVAHLAGALGVPVWVALPYVPDWRWLLERSDSPWYPTMRLFRQKSLGDWAGVFEDVKAELAERVRGEAGASR